MDVPNQITVNHQIDKKKTNNQIKNWKSETQKKLYICLQFALVFGYYCKKWAKPNRMSCYTYIDFATWMFDII